MNRIVDIKEEDIMNISPQILMILLKDNSSGKNIIWATDDYEYLGNDYKCTDNININLIKDNDVIQPRVSKTKEKQSQRARDVAEVFTPSWICNEQNNLIDEQWFNDDSPFNQSLEKGWIIKNDKIDFSTVKDKDWKDYVKDIRLEITCGEAPYLTSRYDSVTGEYIDVPDRIGLLDRKLRVINENTDNRDKWIKWATIALQSIYGYEFQGDSLLIARENVLYTVIEHYYYKFQDSLDIFTLSGFADIISWNLWQMDGLKYVVPYSCHTEDIYQLTLFGEELIETACEGCKKNLVTKHNGIYCIVKDWDKNRKEKFVNIITRGKVK